jgi:protein-S-isoprenylcysteine O-methyltransferase Ste14
MTELIVFLLATLLLLVFTLRRPHAYRFPRLAAFECALALGVFNARDWFLAPFSPRQIASWILLLGSAVLVLHAFWMFRRAGAPQGDIEETSRLVITGAYRYIRHPMYASLFLFGAGALLKSPSLLDVCLLVALGIAVFIAARMEERGNLEKFGEAYRRYMSTTKMFIPFLL